MKVIHSFLASKRELNYARAMHATNIQYNESGVYVYLSAKIERMCGTFEPAPRCLYTLPSSLTRKKDITVSKYTRTIIPH